MPPLRLRHVQQADFRKSEVTNLELMRIVNPHLVNSLRPTDVILFITTSGKQLLFVYGYHRFRHQEAQRTVLPSLRLRLLESSWNPDMLAAYAEEVGLQIINLQLFRQHYANAVNDVLSARPGG